tara:strand:- start:641 stop:1111 length:471 start_codon:yes stop_codon:yes gene_type:complete
MLDKGLGQMRRPGFMMVELVIVIALLASIVPSAGMSIRAMYQSVGHWVETVMRHYDDDYWQDQMRQDVNQAHALGRMEGWLTLHHPDVPRIQYDIRTSCLRRRLYRNNRWYSYTLVCGLSEWSVEIVPGYIQIDYRYQDTQSPKLPLIIGYVCAAV